MKTFTHLLCVLILSIVLLACNNAHFLKEESYRNQVAQDFEQKKQADIAELLGIQRVTVATILRTALQTLRDRYPSYQLF